MVTRVCPRHLEVPQRVRPAVCPCAPEGRQRRFFGRRFVKANACVSASQPVRPMVVLHETHQEAKHPVWTAVVAAARPTEVQGFVQAQVQAAEHSHAVPAAVPAAAHYEATPAHPAARGMLASLVATKDAALAQEAVDGLSEAEAAGGGSTRLPSKVVEQEAAAEAAEAVLAQVPLEPVEAPGLPRPKVANPRPL